MFDCASVEIREQLPELLNELLDADARSRVEAHLATCEECAAELETLRTVRQAYARAPEVDVRRIVAALPRPAVAAPRRASRRVLTWQLAAALATVSVGGVSLAVANRYFVGGTSEPGGRPAVGVMPDTVVRQPSGGRPVDTLRSVPSPAVASAITFGGGVSDLDTEDLEALERALDGIDASMSVEPDHDVPIGPFGREGT